MQNTGLLDVVKNDEAVMVMITTNAMYARPTEWHTENKVR